MNTPVSGATEIELREAMTRLLEGCPARSDGRLTIANLAREAGVGRATANRATAVLVDFRRAVSDQREKRRSQEAIRAKGVEESRNAHVLVQHVQARALNAKLQAGRADCANIVPIK